MEIILVVAGVIMVTLGFLMESPIFKDKFVNPQICKSWVKEEERVKQLKGEVVQAKEDLTLLLTELERASEKVVADIEERIVDVKEQLNRVEIPTNVTPVTEYRYVEVHKPSTATEEVRIHDQANNSPQANKPKVLDRQSNKDKPANKVGKVKEQNRTINNTKLVNNKSVAPKANKQQLIYELADQGLNPNEIAQMAKIGKGEVQLILELRGRSE